VKNQNTGGHPGRDSHTICGSQQPYSLDFHSKEGGGSIEKKEKGDLRMGQSTKMDDPLKKTTPRWGKKRWGEKLGKLSHGGEKSSRKKRKLHRKEEKTRGKTGSFEGKKKYFSVNSSGGDWGKRKVEVCNKKRKKRMTKKDVPELGTLPLKGEKNGGKRKKKQSLFVQHKTWEKNHKINEVRKRKMEKKGRTLFGPAFYPNY